MATTNEGILGGFSGKVGTVVGVKWREKNVLRSLPKPNSSPPSEKQLSQRMRMATASQFLNPLKPLTALYFGHGIKGKSKTDTALSYHLKMAVGGNYPDFNMDYRRVIITKGELPGAYNVQATAAAAASISLSWFNNSDYAQAQPDDALLVVVYNVDKKCFNYSQQANRAAGEYSMKLPEDWTGDAVHLWLSFVSADKTLAANSMYFGKFICLNNQI